VTEKKDQHAEKDHVKTALLCNKYPLWSLNIPPKKQDHLPPKGKDNNQIKQTPIGLPYVKELSEQLIRIYRKYDVPLTISQ